MEIYGEAEPLAKQLAMPRLLIAAHGQPTFPAHAAARFPTGFYAVEADEIVVLAELHLAQNPAAIAGRLE